MASPTHHRSTAEELLEKAKSYGPSAPARLSVLAEAQIHATLYLADLTAAIAAPVRINLGTEAPESFTPAAAPIFAAPAAEDTTDDTPAPAPKRRTRKATAAKTEEAAK